MASGTSNQPQSEPQVVRYVGPASERSLAKADFQLMDPESDVNKKTWELKNHFAVPVSELTPAIVEALQVADGGGQFVVEAPDTKNAVVADKVAAGTASGVGITARTAG